VLHRLSKLIGGLALFAFLAGSAQAEVLVAYVNFVDLLKDAPQAQQIKQNIRQEFQARDQRLVEMQKQIDVLEGKLNADGGRMPVEEKLRLQNDVDTRKLKYKQARDELDRDKQLRFGEEEERLSRVIHEVIQQVAQDDKLDLVLQTGVLWASPKVDITEKVLMRLRAMQEQGN
jgi:outer membrane protein